MDKKEYDKIISKSNLFELNNEKVIEKIGKLADGFHDSKKIDGSKYLIETTKDIIGKRDFSSKQLVVLNYFIANMWSDIRLLTIRRNEGDYSWAKKEFEKEILFLRKAVKEKGFEKIKKARKCQIYTNLGNGISSVGRYVEAIGIYKKSLNLNKKFPMTVGNYGNILFDYALRLYDKGHKNIFFKKSYDNLKIAIKSPQVHDNAKKVFLKKYEIIENNLKNEYLAKDNILKNYSLGEKENEKKYRQWCLEKKLFLNPLNDLGALSIAARDIFHLPNITTGIDEGPFFTDFFNQIKQEFTSARYLLKQKGSGLHIYTKFLILLKEMLTFNYYGTTYKS